MSAAPLSEAEALAMLSEAFGEPVADLRSDTERDSLAGWDSMGALMVMAELDEKYGVELTADESSAMTNVGDLLAFMRARGVIKI